MTRIPPQLARRLDRLSVAAHRFHRWAHHPLCTEYEGEVLRFLPTMMSNADIASELFVSVNTVKTHVKSIYRKLEVTRRQDAVRRARQLHIL